MEDLGELGRGVARVRALALGQEERAEQREDDGHGGEEVDRQRTFAEEAPADLLLRQHGDLTPPQRPAVRVAAGHRPPPGSPIR